METPRFKLGQEYNSYFYKFVPAMELCENGDFVKYHELERLKEELEKCHSEIADKEALIKEIYNLSYGCKDAENLKHIIQMKLR